MNAQLIDGQSAEFFLVYDVRGPHALRQAQRHRRYWGRLYTDLHVLDDVHVVLVFRSGGARWRAWEAVRKEWILGPGKAA